MRGEFSFSEQAEHRYSKSARNLVGRLLRKRSERLTAEEALKDIWLIDFYKTDDEFTRSLTLTDAVLRTHAHALTDNFLLRTSTLRPALPASQEELLRHLKQLKEPWIEEEDSMIYGCEETEPTTPLEMQL